MTTSVITSDVVNQQTNGTGLDYSGGVTEYIIAPDVLVYAAEAVRGDGNNSGSPLLLKNYGSINGSTNGVFYTNGIGSIVNGDGASIYGASTAVYLPGIGIMDNSGTLSAGTNVFQSSAQAGQGNFTILNSGSISCRGNAFYFTDILRAAIYNQGTIQGNATLTGNSEITNAGTIIGEFQAKQATSGASLTIDNSGSFQGNIISSVVSKITNNGKITGNITLGGFDDSYDGRGGTLSGSVSGGAGNDTYIIDDARSAGKIVEAADGGYDTVESDGTSLNLSLFSNIEGATLLGTGNFNLTGNGFDNFLTGNAGRNVLAGGAGDDWYSVQNSDDRIVEAANGGTKDAAFSTVSYTLGANVERLFLLGTAAINGTGNASDNLIYGNSAVNVMNGKGGNDTYYVDNAGDRVIESAGGGSDTVRTSVSYALRAESQVESFGTTSSTSGIAINLKGNSFANAIYGNRGKNVINGGGGADQMRGYAGDDTYYVDNARDVVYEGANAGNDTIYTSTSYGLAGGQSIETLQVAASVTASVNLAGNELANIIRGNAASNTITGGAGNDALAGGGSTDYFVYHAGWGRDKIYGFAAGNAAGHDQIKIDKSQFADYATLMAHTTDTGANTIISHDANNTITLADVHKAALTAADFKFV